MNGLTLQHCQSIYEDLGHNVEVNADRRSVWIEHPDGISSAYVGYGERISCERERRKVIFAVKSFPAVAYANDWPLNC